MGQHSIQTVGRLVDVFENEERVPEIRSVGRAQHRGHETEATTGETPFASTALGPGERQGERRSTRECLSEGVAFGAVEAAGQIARHHRSVEGDQSEPLHHLVQEGREIRVPYVGAWPSRQAAPVESRQQAKQTVPAAGEDDRPDVRIVGQRMKGPQAFVVVTREETAPAAQIGRGHRLVAERPQGVHPDVQAFGVDRPRQRGDSDAVAGMDRRRPSNATPRQEFGLPVALSFRHRSSRPLKLAQHSCALRYDSSMVAPIVPRIEAIKVKNYRALRDLHLDKLTPLSVLVGPNGSGKSTVFDVFAFLSECFSDGLRRAWDRRGRFRELRTRGQGGPIVIELKYREQPKTPLITYHIEIDEAGSGPVLKTEWLRWKRKSYGAPFRFLDFAQGQGSVIEGETPDQDARRVPERLDSPDVLAVNALGQLARHPRVSSLRRFITGWHLSYLSGDSARGVPEAGPQEHLSQSGDNLPNVVQFLKEQHPSSLNEILEILRNRIPRLENVDATILEDGRLLLRFKDAPFDAPILAKNVSDGTLKMLAYLTLLNDPERPPLIGIEEPENFLHPRLLQGLAEECREASATTQLMVTSHSPQLVNGLRPDEVWILDRDDRGFTAAKRVAAIPGVSAFVKEGALLGDLWMEGYLVTGEPLATASA